MKIGVFLPYYSTEKIKKVLASYTDVEFHYYSYKTLPELNSLFTKNQTFLDGYLFSGKLAYLSLLENNDAFLKPAQFIQMSEADFYKTLFHIAKEHPDIDYSRVFIDFQSEAGYIKEFIDSQPIDSRPIGVDEKEVEDFSPTDVYEKAVSFHKMYHETGEADWSFTRFVNILDDFKQHGINHYYFEISDKTIKVTVQDLIDQITLVKLKSNQIVFGYLDVQVANLKLLESKLLYIHSRLLELNYHMNEQLSINRTDLQLEITSNYSTLEELTNQFSSCNILKLLDNEEDIFHLGWGTGESFTHAKINAKHASKLSLNNQISSSFVYKADGEIIGPLTQSDKVNKKQIALQSIDLNRLQEKLGITSDRLNKILLVFSQVGREHVTSATFADILNISVRSANRILNEAVEKGLIAVTEDRQSGLQGRPRRFYTLNEDSLS